MKMDKNVNKSVYFYWTLPNDFLPHGMIYGIADNFTSTKPLLSICCHLFIIPVFHEEYYLCGTYRYVVVPEAASFWLYKPERCFEKGNFSFICTRGMSFSISYRYWKSVWSSTDGRQCSYLIIITLCWISEYKNSRGK